MGQVWSVCLQPILDCPLVGSLEDVDLSQLQEADADVSKCLSCIARTLWLNGFWWVAEGGS